MAGGAVGSRQGMRSRRFFSGIGRDPRYLLEPPNRKEQMNSESILKKRHIPKDSMVARRIATEVIIVPVRKSTKEVDNIYATNDTGARIWELMDGTRSLEQIIAKIVEEYEVDESIAQQDAIEFVTKLLTIDALDEV